MKDSVRVRFAPSPTGLMHLGSVRIALFNYLFAKQKDGTFILRIEDTDPERNFDPGAQQIMRDMAWLGLAYEEGPDIGGPYKSYFQSERSSVYQERLDILKEKNAIYRCFCSPEELEKKRLRQIALKQPPRYDRTCLNLTQATITKNIEEKKPFIWRFKIDHTKKVFINDLARGSIEFDLQHFSDFPLTRATGTFTFIFANAIDDMVMKISHVIRGEDHISNTPCQTALFEAFNVPLPTFWHMPIICNIEGKKLSKRDFGFSLQDLKNAGFLAEAINNYLAIIGASFEQEIMSMNDLIKTINFEHIHSTNAIKYDVEKLRWVNHQWIIKLNPEQLAAKTLPFITQNYPQATQLPPNVIVHLIQAIQPELKTLADAPLLLKFYFEKPAISKKDLFVYAESHDLDAILNMINDNHALLDTPDTFVETIKKEVKANGIPLKIVWHVFRVILTGSPSGPGIKELIILLGKQEIITRLNAIS